jgi:GT2 family glycosyltransferase
MTALAMRAALTEGMRVEVAAGSRWIVEFSAMALRDFQSFNLLRDDDVLLHVIHRPEAGMLILNDCIGGAWGPEWSVDAPRVGLNTHITVDLHFLDAGLFVAVRGGESATLRGRFVVRGEVEAAMPRTISLAQPMLSGEPVHPGHDGCADGDLPNTHRDPQPTVPLAATPTGVSLSGVIDECTFSPAVGGWLVTGWMPAELPSEGGGRLAGEVLPVEVCARNEILAIQYPRPDIREIGHAFVLLIPHELSDTPLAPPQQITLTISPGVAARLTPSPGFTLRDEASMHRLVRDVLAIAHRGAIQPIGALLNRANFTGQDSFGPLGAPVHIEVDEVIRVRPGAALLLGWCLDPLGLVESIHLCRGPATSAPLHDAWIRTPRQDIVDAFTTRYGMVDRDTGFVAWADTQSDRDGTLFLEIKLRDGRTGLKPLPLPLRRGAAAMHRALSAAKLPGNDLDRVFDRVLGAPLVELNRHRLARTPFVREERFGAPPAAPRVSLVVPLYGRLDFMRCQLAVFSGQNMAQDEIIYVLDQPERSAELIAMARSAHGSLGTPFRVLLQDENRGFGPSSNAGLAAAAGQHVLFLNSDVFPEGADWLDRLVADLDEDPDLGIVGPLLLFADGSVQHASMALEPVPDLSGWLFPRHPMKGRVPPAGGPRLRRSPTVTGAAMLLRRDVALELGGFDPDYAIGDFEDADLCLRAAVLGLRCAVDMTVRARHLERQSQNAGPAEWRRNVTLLNAWTFNRRIKRTAHAQ